MELNVSGKIENLKKKKKHTQKKDRLYFFLNRYFKRVSFSCQMSKVTLASSTECTILQYRQQVSWYGNKEKGNEDGLSITLFKSSFESEKQQPDGHGTKANCWKRAKLKPEGGRKGDQWRNILAALPLLMLGGISQMGQMCVHKGISMSYHKPLFGLWVWFLLSWSEALSTQNQRPLAWPVEISQNRY